MPHIASGIVDLSEVFEHMNFSYPTTRWSPRSDDYQKPHFTLDDYGSAVITEGYHKGHPHG